MRYVDRQDAGRRLAPIVAKVLTDLAHGVDLEPPLVLGVPRGGVVVGYEIAKALPGDFEVALARKIGAPHNPELAIGAIGEYGEPVIDRDLVGRLGVSESYLREAIENENRELHRRSHLYRGDFPPPIVTGRVVIVADDGIATGATLRAVLAAVRVRQPGHLICAVPVGAPDSVAAVSRDVDTMICPQAPSWFRAVGEWYESFTQTSDSEVLEILAAARQLR
jgi:predicted phosphoribosyltransferase